MSSLPIKTMKAIIFDLDGTLINSIPAHQHITAKVAKEFDLELDESDFVKVNGRTTRAGIECIAKEKNLSLDIDAFMAVHKKALVNIFDEITIYPQVISTLQALKDMQSFKLAVATSSPKDYLDHALDKFELRQFFDCTSSSNDIKNAKPDPEIFLNSAEQLDLSPAECLVIEDAPQGVIAANRAGMTTIALLTTTAKEHFVGEAEPKVFVEEFKDLLNCELIK